MDSSLWAESVMKVDVSCCANVEEGSSLPAQFVVNVSAGCCADVNNQQSYMIIQ